MNKWSAVGVPHYKQTQESEERENQYTGRENQYILRIPLSRVNQVAMS